MGHGGTKESNLVTETTISVNDFVRVVTSGSRKITLSNFLTSSVEKLKELGFITDIVNVRLRDVKTPAITSNYGLMISDDIVPVDPTAASFAINLMTAASAWDSVNEQGYVFVVKRIDSSLNKVTLNPPGAELIDGEPSLDLIDDDRPSVTFYSDGTNWWTI